MNEPRKAIYEYECDDCRRHFQVEMDFRQRAPFDRDEQGQELPTGYPEQQPECPTCHSHDVVRVDVRQTD